MPMPRGAVTVTNRDGVERRSADVGENASTNADDDDDAAIESAAIEKRRYAIVLAVSFLKNQR